MQFRFERKGNDWYAPPIDPSDESDYQIDFSKVLGEDTISSAEWKESGGITILTAKCTNTDTSATVWLRDAVAGTVYTVTAHIETVGGREFDRSFKIFCRDL